MRSLILCVVMLLAGKLGWQEWTYRAALADTVTRTFRTAAIAACQRESAARNIKVAATVWSQPGSMSLVVGSGTADASFWQVSDDLFRTSPAHPILVIVVRQKPVAILCEYDVVRQQASIYRR